MFETKITVTGILLADPTSRQTRAGNPMTTFRVGTRPRRRPGSTREPDDLVVQVCCWRDLAVNCARSLRKGMPVVVTGQLKMRQVEVEVDGRLRWRTYTDLNATDVGPNLAYGCAQYQRERKPASVQRNEGVIAERVLAEARATQDHQRPGAA